MVRKNLCSFLNVSDIERQKDRVRYTVKTRRACSLKSGNNNYCVANRDMGSREWLYIPTIAFLCPLFISDDERVADIRELHEWSVAYLQGLDP